MSRDTGRPKTRARLSQYKFRLRLAANAPHKFAFDTNQETFQLAEDLQLTLVARNANSLDEATTFHIDGSGFRAEPDALAAGEALRTRLRLLNAILGLGLNVPVGNTPSGKISDDLKREVASKYGVVALDNVWGLLTFPDDGRHFEYVVGGKLVVRPSEPRFVFDALKTLWTSPVHLDGPSEEALHILGLAGLETSDKAAFLTTFLALEQLVELKPRSIDAKRLIDRFVTQLHTATKRKRSPVKSFEAHSLRSALAALHKESLSGALARLGRSVTNPAQFQGVPVQRFISACIDARNKIAHHAEPRPTYPLTQLTTGLREVAIQLIWSRNQLPTLTFKTSASSISAPAGAIAVRLL